MRLIKRGEPTPSDFDLSSELVGLCKFGSPRLALQSRGWCCSIEMNTNAEGASFNVHSEFDHPSPEDALIMCKARAKSAVKKISENL